MGISKMHATAPGLTATRALPNNAPKMYPAPPAIAK